VIAVFSAKMASMATIQYTSTKGKALSYEITTDKHGNYEIKHAGKVVKRQTVPTAYLGKPRWGSKKLETQAIEDAKIAIEALKTGEG
jgi:hypothetical protein